MASNFVFPRTSLTNAQHGHWMVISAVGRGSDNTALATYAFFIPGGAVNGPMMWSSRHEYQEAKMSKITTGAATNVPVVGTAIGALAGAAPMAGYGINPKVEVLYRDTQLRTFDFNFTMAPQDKPEADELRNMVQSLRSYAAPELVEGTSDPKAGYIGSAAGQKQYLSTGGLFRSPSEFLITFYYINQNGQAVENDNIPRIGRCIIEGIDVNYTPQGEWSTFYDGQPTTLMLSMTFKEMRVIDRQNISEGGY